MRTTVARLVTLALLLAACSPSESADSTTSSAPTSSTSSSSTSTSTSTTSTTIETGETSLINGLPVDDPALLDRRVMAVKIDNHPRARPQSGLDHADMVIEMLVEGITRFISIWHESDMDYLGPNRSGRPTDANLLPAFNHPTFTISGAQGWVQNMITGNGVNLIKELSEGTFRISSRSAPHNLYVDTFILRETADERGYENEPPLGPIWTFGEMILLPGSGAYIADIAPAGRRGQYMGFYTMAFGTAFALGPWLGTLVLERAGAWTLWLGCLGAGAVSTLMLMRLRGGEVRVAD